MTAPSGLDFTDWLGGLFRGFQPLRSLLCLLGVVLTGLSAVVAKSVFEQAPPDWRGWQQHPMEQVQALSVEIWEGSLGRIILGGGPLLALDSMLWCLIGGWIARHELLARQRDRGASLEWIEQPSATAFLIGWRKPLLTCCPCVLAFAIMMLLPVAFAGWVNTWLGSLGAVVVSLLLPGVLLADLFLLVVVLGASAWPLMPIAVAAEFCDSWETISRSYNYFFRRPIRFLVLTVIALGLAGLPLGVLCCYAEQMTTWQPELRFTAFVLAAALSISIFWSLQTLVYLHLRSAVDGVDANEIAAGSLPPRESPKPPSPEGKAAETPTSTDNSPDGGRGLVRLTIMLLASAAGSWCLTFWLFSRASRGQVKWLGWGLSDTFVPSTKGVYRVASVIAGLWGVAWLALPLAVALRRLFRGGALRTKNH